jgi:hypothetical protein
MDRSHFGFIDVLTDTWIVFHTFLSMSLCKSDCDLLFASRANFIAFSLIIMKIRRLIIVVFSVIIILTILILRSVLSHSANTNSNLSNI